MTVKNPDMLCTAEVRDIMCGGWWDCAHDGSEFSGIINGAVPPRLPPMCQRSVEIATCRCTG